MPLHSGRLTCNPRGGSNRRGGTLTKNARDFSSASGAAAQFAVFLQNVAHAFPQVKDYVIGNEPNQPYFWLPQYDSDGKPLSAATYEPVLAQAYDALKGVDPSINVIG